MSRIPLLLRSSPATGAGSSYGGLPVQYLSSSAEVSDSDSLAEAVFVKCSDKRKGKGIMRQSDPALDAQIPRLENGHSRTAHSEATLQRRKPGKIKGPSYQSIFDATLFDSIEGHMESGLEPRFTGGGVDTAIEGMDHISSEGPSSSGCSNPESSTDNDDESAEDLKLNDKSIHTEPADNSPYAQVRASVAPADDTSLSINTPRMWILSLLFAILGSSTNLFFSLRYPSVSITPVIALLLVHPLGLLWDGALKCEDDPAEIFVNGNLQSRIDIAVDSGNHRRVSQDESQQSLLSPRFSESYGKLAPNPWKRRLRLWLAQGRWNQKEHCCVYVSSNVSFGFAFATDVIVEQTQFYHQQLGITYQVLLTISTQVLGYALAGITRRFLVRPSGMIWPGTLISTAMFSTLHNQENKPADGWRISRSRFFLWVFLGSVGFYFLPGLLFPALSYFSVITWFAPKNVVIANLFGVTSGLGLFPLTFDWSQITYTGSPLVVPFWAALNIMGGLVFVMWLLAPIMYYLNILYSAYMPILSAAVFDNTGNVYDVSRILTKDFLFDEEAYHKYSRVFLPITYVLSYALQFAALAALMTHTACWHGRDIWRQWKHSLEEIRNSDKVSYEALPVSSGNRFSTPVSRRRANTNASEPGLDNLMAVEDVHNRLMRRYDDVPISWYLLTGVAMTAIGMFVVEYFPIHLPWYGLLLALSICTVLFIPIGIVMAIANQQSSLYLICQLICGVVFPGRPVANMVFVTYGYITSTQGLKFSSDLKLGHYMKIPPRILFYLQLSATVISSMTQIGVLNWMLANIPGICTPDAINGFNCPIARVHFNGSILWGVVGPQRFFGPGALYRPLVWAFLIGALAPIVLWYIARNKRKSVLRYVNLPVMFGSLSWIPPATGLNFSVWFVVCWLFNEVLRKRKPAWWRKYTMTLSAALDSGVAVGVVVIFFGILYPGWMKGFKWWGTEVYKQGCDWQACSYKEVAPGQTFGPKNW
ncbi:OPT-domain-containing protein [Patellaria atrata CBS 101060]|uniref:OPT-domain-containing protein n=1 Tax=Patellaria atrata CBS 101060 TaxID=1346257 RepID=A0A9P4SI44_9PEZI|nr:OPT-domain-containing protein [Patellaria atrata CBS 101060]